MFDSRVGARIQTRREEFKLSREDLAKWMGLGNAEALSAIEAGRRPPSVEELVSASKHLQAPITYFTDPFILAGEGRFSWRQAGVPTDELDRYEREAGRLIAAFRSLEGRLGRKHPSLPLKLQLNVHSSYEDALAAGERLAVALGLGEVPARELAAALERQGVLILMVDAIEGVSGAACKLPDLDAVLINRNEVPGRRNYSLAHELFHILTWDRMPPERVEDTRTPARGRVEQLADNFARALLMPTAALARFDPWDLTGDALVAKLNETAEAIDVTAVALKWRLIGLGKVQRSAAPEDELLAHNGRGGSACAAPARFSEPFARMLSQSLERGLLSVRRAASLLGVTVDDLTMVFGEQGIKYELGI